MTSQSLQYTMMEKNGDAVRNTQIVVCGMYYLRVFQWQIQDYSLHGRHAKN